MNWKHAVSVLGMGVAGLILAATPACAQVCNISLVNAKAPPPDLNAEGITERGADLKIQGAACFAPNQPVTVSFNAVMSAPASFGLGDVGKYWAIADPTDSLAIGGVIVSTAVTATGTVTVIEFDVETGSTSPGATLILENLRFDVTGTTGVKYQMVPDGQPLNAYVSTQVGGIINHTYGPLDIGNVHKTVSRAGVYEVGWGFEDGVCPFAGKCGYPNKGATTGSLIDQAWWYMNTNPAWTTDFPFRRVGESSGNPADPNSLGPTDLVINVENIMGGVTVTLPDSLKVCDSESGLLAQWDWFGGAKTATGGNLAGIYRTSFAAGPSSVQLRVATTDGAPDNGCDVRSRYPLIQVKVGNPSLNSADGTMQAYLRVVMGPASKAQFTGDDVQASAIPRYLNDIAAADLPSRSIIGDSDPDMTVPYFYLNPTQTVLLYPFVTSMSGWNTGIEIGNTGNDSPVFGNTGQAGKLDFYFYPTNGTPFAYTVAAGVGRGLDVNGNLQPGGDFADSLTDLVAKAGKPFTEGYIIVVAHFNYGHGTAMVFNTGGALTSVPALVLGGHCTFNPNKGQPIPSTGAPSFPACSSARQGDLTKLPEQLKM